MILALRNVQVHSISACVRLRTQAMNRSTCVMKMTKNGHRPTRRTLINMIACGQAAETATKKTPIPNAHESMSLQGKIFGSFCIRRGFFCRLIASRHHLIQPLMHLQLLHWYAAHVHTMRNSIPTKSSQTRPCAVHGDSVLLHTHSPCASEICHKTNFEQKGTHNSRNKFASKFIGIHQPLEDNATNKVAPRTGDEKKNKTKNKRNA